MTKAVANIVSQLDTFTQQERAELVKALLRSLEPEGLGVEGASAERLLDSLRQVPAERWGEVMRFLEGLKGAAPPIRTGADLLRAGLIGLWGDRDDLGDSREFARRLRQQAQTRPGAVDAAGH